MTITIADLFLILPVLVLTGTAVLAMSAVAVGRNYPVTAFITVAGLLLAALSAVTLMPGQSAGHSAANCRSLFFVFYSSNLPERHVHCGAELSVSGRTG